MAGFKPSTPLEAKVMMSMAAPVLDCKSIATSTPARKVRLEEAERKRHCAFEPLSVLERSGALAHLLKAEKDEAHPEQRAGNRLPERNPNSSKRDSRASDYVGNEGMNVERRHECKRCQTDIGPDDNGRSGARLDKPAVGEADQNESHGGRALHDGTGKSSQPRSE